MTARSAARRARRETVILALLAYRPGGWSANDLQAHCGGTFVGLYRTLGRLEASGRVRGWFEDGARPRRRLYDVAGSAFRAGAPSGGVVDDGVDVRP